MWRAKGIDVLLSTNDASSKEGATKLISESQGVLPLGGIFHLAGVLKVGWLRYQTKSTFASVCEPKYNGTLFLDELTRNEEIAKSLHWFVVFSSTSSGIGLEGNSNYGFANSTMERICEKRVEDGFPGLAIQWGAIRDVGMAQVSFKVLYT